uniref:Uncharacterized protein n=1 Tax=Anguilla anguilla TaxID=7936 RepID=A0A0E9SF49_ANGAN
MLNRPGSHSGCIPPTSLLKNKITFPHTRELIIVGMMHPCWVKKWPCVTF